MRKLQANPNDSQAMTEMYKSQEQVNVTRDQDGHESLSETCYSFERCVVSVQFLIVRIFSSNLSDEDVGSVEAAAGSVHRKHRSADPLAS